jgi:hypothetical protein
MCQKYDFGRRGGPGEFSSGASVAQALKVDGTRTSACFIFRAMPPLWNKHPFPPAGRNAPRVGGIDRKGG